MPDDTAPGREPGARRGPLDGIVVVDLTRALAGPHAAMMMADLGARVIKVERPGGGDDTRGWGPPFVQPPSGARESTYFLSANRGKESIVLDLATPDGRDALASLVERADVLLENFSTGVLDRLGFPMERLHELNPGLVVLSISGFGHDGPEAGRPGYDQIAQGEAGLMSLTGPSPDEPMRVGLPVADLLAGMYGAYGVLAALLERNRTGQGQLVRSSLLSAVVGIHAYQGTRWTVAGEVPMAQGNHHLSIAPYGLFRCRDGAVQISVGSEALWQRLCAAFDLDADNPDMVTNADRVAHRDEVIAVIEGAFATWDAEPLLARLAEVNVPAGKVRRLDQVYEWEQTRSQGLLVDVDHPTLGPITLPGPPLRFFTADGSEVTKTEHRAPPVLDGDADRIREWLAGDRDGPAHPDGSADPDEQGQRTP